MSFSALCTSPLLRVLASAPAVISVLVVLQCCHHCLWYPTAIGAVLLQLELSRLELVLLAHGAPTVLTTQTVTRQHRV